MKIDDKLLDKLQNLSYIKIDDDKKEQTKESLSEILDYMDKLSQVDIGKDEVKQIDKTYLHDDIVKNSDVIDSVLNGISNKKDGFFIVPKIIE